ncbi:unnamed protein product [Mucor fragilis]
MLGSQKNNKFQHCDFYVLATKDGKRSIEAHNATMDGPIGLIEEKSALLKKHYISSSIRLFRRSLDISQRER